LIAVARGAKSGGSGSAASDLLLGLPTQTTLHAIAAEILRERHGATGAVTVHETWGASIVVEADNLLLKANGDRSTMRKHWCSSGSGTQAYRLHRSSTAAQIRGCPVAAGS
jgi:hypothetical protein